MSTKEIYDKIWAEFSGGGSIAAMLKDQANGEIRAGLTYLSDEHGAAFIKTLLIHGIPDLFFGSVVELFWLMTAFGCAAAKAEEVSTAERAEVYEKYARLLAIYVSNVYNAEFLAGGDLKKIDPTHAFGSRMFTAFELLDNGDKVGYLRKLREILSEHADKHNIISSLLRSVA